MFASKKIPFGATKILPGETYKSTLSVILGKYTSLDWRHLLLLVDRLLVQTFLVAPRTGNIIAARFLTRVI
jgi:hypothetical protein